MTNLHYYVTSVVHLSLEDYHNRGLKPEETRQIIESMRSPGSSSLNIRCEPSGVNHNWDAHVLTDNRFLVEFFIEDLKFNLDQAFYEKLAEKSTNEKV